MSSQPGTQPKPPFLRPFLALFALGLVGLLGLYLITAPLAYEISVRAGMPDVSVTALRLMLLINPGILMLIFTALGTLAAPRVGLRSHVAERAARVTRRAATPFTKELPLALGVGVVAALVVLVLDPLARPLLGPAAAGLQTIATQPRTVTETVAGMLYGGISEELMMRWGVLSVVAWLVWRTLFRGRAAPPPSIFRGAILVAAVLFGVGHLGVVAAEMPLTGPLVVRTVVLNAVGGVAFGWLFWRRSLEAAMVAHATTHVVFTVVSWIVGGAIAA